jgi:hypothetical protein
VKDAHVVAAAMSLKAPFLLTLDQPFARELAQSGLPLLGISSGDFIKGRLPDHPDASFLRDDL